jgi:hypothetical protein
MKIKTMKYHHPLFFILFLTTACRTAEIPVTDSLTSEATSYPVKGRQGLKVGQLLSFGDYRTGTVQRGWTKSYAIPFVVQFSGSREKLSFQQFGPDNRMASVALISHFRETEFASLEEYFSLSVKHKNHFAGGIELSDTKESWEFIVHSIDGRGNTLKNNTLGYVRSKVDQLQIDIVGIRELEGTSRLMTMMDVYGYEFRLNGKTIGAVSTVNNGKVWLKNTLHPELKLVLASVSSGLMLRNSVREEAEQLTLNR